MPMPVGLMMKPLMAEPQASQYLPQSLKARGGAMAPLGAHAGVPAASAEQHAVARMPWAAPVGGWPSPIVATAVLPAGCRSIESSASSTTSEGTQCGSDELAPHIRAAKEALALASAAAKFDKYKRSQVKWALPCTF